MLLALQALKEGSEVSLAFPKPSDENSEGEHLWLWGWAWSAVLWVCWRLGLPQQDILVGMVGGWGWG
jgi:hypothetical protein